MASVDCSGAGVRAAPDLRIERAMLRAGSFSVAGIDEVGRGSLCGPATVGAVVVTSKTRTAPSGVRDSKLLSPRARQELVPRIQRWAASYAVGHASPSEVDAIGIIAALRLAGHRALAALPALPDAILLDGNHDYLTPEQDSLFGLEDLLPQVPPVLTVIKADLKCAAVAAASILAKTARDSIMIELAAEFPEYAWAENKGYSAPEHIAALHRLGPTPHHRRSWHLPGVSAGWAALDVG